MSVTCCSTWQNPVRISITKFSVQCVGTSSAFILILCHESVSTWCPFFHLPLVLWRTILDTSGWRRRWPTINCPNCFYNSLYSKIKWPSFLPPLTPLFHNLLLLLNVSSKHAVNMEDFQLPKFRTCPLVGNFYIKRYFCLEIFLVQKIYKNFFSKIV